MPPRKSITRKARNLLLTEDYLASRESGLRGAGYGAPKWMLFARVMMRRGFQVRLYEAQRTVSKYVTVTNGQKAFKVRFSDHAPIFEREANGDCDFFVGHTNFGKTSTNDALKATMLFFGEFGGEGIAPERPSPDKIEAYQRERYAMEFEDLTV
jgi:hypothetical protein